MNSSRLIALIAVLGLAGVAAMRAQQKPNFAGTWIALSPTGAEELHVHEHTATGLSIRHESSGDSYEATYNLDSRQNGAVRIIQMDGVPVVSRSSAVWNGEQLEIAETTEHPGWIMFENKQTWSLNAQGQLVIRHTRGPVGGTATSSTVTIFRKE
jgi:hypothetical protein